MKQLKLTLFALFLCSWAAFGQKPTNVLDSLSNLLKTPLLSDSSRADILRKEGLEFVTHGNYPKAVELFLKSKDLFQSIGNEYGVFRCDNIIGFTYSLMGDTKTGLNYLLKCKKGIDDGLLYSNLGLVYHDANYKTNSLIYYKMALDFYKQKKDTMLIARLLNDVGSLEEEFGRVGTAIEYYNECLRISNDKINSSIAYASLGDAYYSQGKYNLAIFNEEKSLKIAREISDLTSVSETLKTLSNAYFKIGNCDKAFSLYKEHINLKGKLVNEERIKEITRVEESAKFDTEKKIQESEQEKRDAITQQQKQKQIVIIYSISIGLILVIIFSIFLFRAFKRNKKAKIIITEQKKKIESKNKDITDNINYAQKIQKAILPSDEYMKKCFPDNFIIYKPKDIVSGDFYWAFYDGSSKYLATADCTSHGTVASMITMIGTQLLNEIVIQRKITSPELVLNTLRDEIIKTLNQEGASEERKEGMDISFLKITDMKLECALANNPIFIVRNGEIKEIKSNRFPVGKYVKNESFTLNTLELQKEDIIYTLSDGMADQFGGGEGKKLMIKRLKSWMIELSTWAKMETIKYELEQKFNSWIGEEEQVDDVTIVSFKI